MRGGVIITIGISFMGIFITSSACVVFGCRPHVSVEWTEACAAVVAVWYIVTVAVTVVVIDIPFIGIGEGGVMLLLISLILWAEAIWLLLELVSCEEVDTSTAPSCLTELGSMLCGSLRPIWSLVPVGSSRCSTARWRVSALLMMSSAATEVVLG